jgi:hypothetical protein
VTDKAPSGRRKVARLGVAAAAVAAAVLLAPWKRCGAELGFWPGGAPGTGEPDRPKGAVGEGTAGDQAPRSRCKVRLDASGLRLDGAASEQAAVVTACKAAGGADVVVTGDAVQGAWDGLRVALLEAGVEVYVRGAADGAGGGDAGAAAAPVDAGT